MSSANSIFVVFNSLFSAAFLLSALVQWNDPDPALWMLYYFSAFVCSICAFRRLPIYPALLTLVVGAIWGVVLLLNLAVTDVAMVEVLTSLTMSSDEVEEAREIGGLLIVVIWLGYLFFRQLSRVPTAVAGN